MFDTLMAKTFLILGSQLFVTYLGAVVVLKYVHGLYKAGHPAITATENREGQIDLDIDWQFIRLYFFAILVVDIILFLILLFAGQDNLTLGIPVFIGWSVLTGIELALALISVDENLGARVLGITVCITVICALIGMYSGIDFSFLGAILFLALTLLLVANIIRLFVRISRPKQRVMAFFGVLVFIGYLLYDFNRLSQKEEVGINSWLVAMDLSISIYLDIINLFLDLLDLLSD